MARRPLNGSNGRATRFKSGEQAAKNGKKGGIASGVAKRQAKTLSSIASQIAAAPITNKKNLKKLEKLGVDTAEGVTNNALISAGVYMAAASGDMKAVEKWEEWTEASSAAGESSFELPARCIGKAFVDLNRHIEPNGSYILNGGRGSTKSSFVSLKIIETLRRNPEMHACVCRKVGGTMRDSVYAQIKWAIHELRQDSRYSCKVSPMEITDNVTGQIIYFRGLDDETKIKSIKPPFGAIGILWVEEADQMDGAEQLRSVRQSVLRGGSDTYEFMSYNPPAAARNWMNRFVLEPHQNTVVHHSCYLDAPPEWLGERFLQDAEALKENNEIAYKHEYLGEVTGCGKEVFTNIRAEKIDPAKFERKYHGIDWGWYPDPFAYNCMSYDAARKTLYIYDEITVRRTRNEDTFKMLQERHVMEHPESERLTADSAEPKSCTDYTAWGMKCLPAIKGPNSVGQGVKWLQSLTAIVIDPVRCPDTLKEFTEYEYDADKNGEPLPGYPDHDNHHIDATRYAMELVWHKPGK